MNAQLQFSLLPPLTGCNLKNVTGKVTPSNSAHMGGLSEEEARGGHRPVCGGKERKGEREKDRVDRAYLLKGNLASMHRR